MQKWRNTCLILGIYFLSVFFSPTVFAAEELSITKTAQKYLGFPYIINGQEPNQGFSTGGLTKYVFKEVKNVDLPMSPREQFNLGKAIDRKDLLPGDLIFFSGMNTSEVTSVGIYNGNDEVIISTVSKGVIITKLTEGSYYADRYISAKRIETDNLYQVEHPLLVEAMKYVGTNYSSNGKTPDEGFNPAGFVQFIFEKSLNLNLPENSSGQWSIGTNISKEDLQPGDVLFFKNKDTGEITTTAFYVGNGNMIYSSVSEGVTTINFEQSSYWNDRYYGAKRITEVPDIDRKDPLINEALKYIGVPYLEGGKTPKGFDCSGFTKYVYEKAMGIHLSEAPEQQWLLGTPVEKKDIEIGDLVFFKDTHRPGISHVGIYAGNNQMIHASRTQTAKVETIYLSNNYYTEKFAGIRRVKNLKIPENIPVIKKATDLLDVPYLSGGTTPEGFDTGGFIQYVYRQIGIELPRYGKDMLQKGTEVKEGDLQPGDLVFFESNSIIPAIYIGNEQIAVVSRSEGVRIVNYKVSSYWGPIYHSARRIL
ncbi:C40 family peptidase [Bacillus sp. FJAT-49705]|uniref:C40 family peptidase n=1 Tax=Cytobacillus citreus TaxID=2833586 RepID=A0ABS5NNU9_9BACI|nr:C40 family peptidase [Cytobacillus citreus]MBS4189505.1 C40 family peptidase [Cytobacillus citreus]